MLARLALALMIAGAQLPAPTGHVNDQAGVLSAAERDELESRLRAYEEQTSVEIAVLITETTGQETIERYATRVFNAWGVGKKGLNNGVLLVIATKDRALRIETGYGIEPDLPDVQARRIIDYEIVPHFRSGDMAGGVKAGVDALIKRLGTTSWGDRIETRRRVAEQRARERAEAAAAMRRFFSTAGLILGVSTLLALLGAIGVAGRRTWREWRRKASLRRTLTQELIPGAKTQLEQARAAFTATLHDVHATMPAPLIEKDADARERDAKQAADAAASAIERAERLVQRAPDEAAKIIRYELRDVDTLRRITQELEGLRERYVRAKREAPRAIASARARIGRARTEIAALVEKGYRLDADTKLDRAMRFNADAESKALSRDFVEALRLAGNATDEADSVHEWARDFETWIARTTARLDAAEQKVTALAGKALTTAAAVAETLGDEYPKPVWQELAPAIASAPRTIDALKQRIDAARTLASMETQDFGGAASAATEIENAVHSLTHTIARPAEVLKAQEAARKRWHTEIAQARKASEQAHAAAKDSDVSEETRKKLKPLDKRLEALEEAAGQDKVDWVSSVAEARALAEAYTSIKTKAEAEKADARRRRRMRTPSYSSSSSVYGSHGGFGGGYSYGGGFGGFGGGMSGGGGASGRW